MPGHVPGIPGWIAFAGVKFGGYYLAGMALKKLQPAIVAGAAKISATRTGLGILIGLPVTIGLSYVFANLLPQSQLDMALYGIYAFIYALRVLVWVLVIYLFTRQIGLRKSKLWLYAALGAAWSCLLDLPGIGLAMISPGQVPFC
ncbi:MAG TPA: hypothetical protein VKH15_04770 [Candidatus Acidoferrum sp.]|nr:hypothetical protein [Candidatus Acidoferrum sp.]